MLRSSEPKLMSEVSNLRQAMSRMREEMEQFKDIDGLKRAFDSTQIKLTVSQTHDINKVFSYSIFLSVV